MLPAALAALLASMRCLSSAAYSVAYLAAFSAMLFLEAARVFLASARAAICFLVTASSLACFLAMLSGIILALKQKSRNEFVSQHTRRAEKGLWRQAVKAIFGVS